MKKPGPHAMLPEMSQEEQSRLSFFVSLSGAARRVLKPGNELIYERDARPAFVAEHGREPATVEEVREVMEKQEFYQMWTALSRSQQEQYVDCTGSIVERQLPDLVRRFREISGEARLGSLELDAELDIPYYQKESHQHCVPLSYYEELGEDDVYAGARADIGSYAYSRGLRGLYNDDKGLSGSRFVKENFPDLNPERILDLGCMSGNSTVPYVDAYPDAAVHAIDLGAPQLRYAHARAESMGKRIHFSQQNAECMKFDDDSFELVVSHILFHETSRQAILNILREVKRVLKPGGVFLHVEVPVRRDTPFAQFLANWDSWYNNEPFWGILARTDINALAVEAGFDEERIFDRPVYSQAPGGVFRKGDGWWGFGARN